VYDEVVEGSEWVIDGEGKPYEKFDGTACMVMGGRLYKRFDRKWNKKKKCRRDAPDGWMPCEELPNEHTGHWPGWVPVGDGPEDQWHREAMKNEGDDLIKSGTYELCGPKILGNPHGFSQHTLVSHDVLFLDIYPQPPRTFDALKEWLDKTANFEGIVWHHPDGRMVKIKRKDFGLSWPQKQRNKE